MDNPELLVSVIKTSLCYEEYKTLAEKELNSFDLLAADKIATERNDARKINLVRMSRIEKQFLPEVKSIELLKNISKKLLWLVISENWCGDSAQSLPVIAKLASLNPMIDLKIILRDKNSEFMNNYLTNGKRSIPKFIIYDEDFQELATWGPRPKSAQMLMDRMMEEQIEKTERLEKLHLWYAKNQGKEIEKEVISSIKSLIVNREVIPVNQS